MGGINAITDRLHASHAVFIVDFDNGLGASNNEAPQVTRVVDCVVPVLFIEHDVFDLTAQVGGPAEDAAIKARAQELLLVHRLVPCGLPCETRDGEIHVFIFDLVKTVAQHR